MYAESNMDHLVFRHHYSHFHVRSPDLCSLPLHTSSVLWGQGQISRWVLSQRSFHKIVCVPLGKLQALMVASRVSHHGPFHWCCPACHISFLTDLHPWHLLFLGHPSYMPIMGFVLSLDASSQERALSGKCPPKGRWALHLLQRLPLPVYWFAFFLVIYLHSAVLTFGFLLSLIYYKVNTALQKHSIV